MKKNTVKNKVEALYNGPRLDAVRRRHDPDNRLTTLHDKAVRRQ